MADLIEGGLAEGDAAAVLLSEGEPPDPADERLPSVSRWTSPSPDSIEAELPQGASHVFIVTDGRRNPVDQIEAFKNWLGLRASQVDVVLCVVDCRLAEKHTRLLAWFEACIFFSDVVLLNHREGVGNKWVGDFIERFHKKFYPCLFEFVKEGGVKNPALVLSPVARRMSHVFDEQEWVPDEEEDDEESEDDVEMKPEEDYYMERRNGGRRVHELPHIADFLPPLA